MEITSNLTSVIGDLLGKFSELGNPDTVTRAIATAMMPTIRKRIHVEGKNSNGSQIGVYSNSYLKLRQKKYNRTADTDVIASLTRQLVNSYVLGATKDGYTIDNLGNKIDNDAKTKTEYLEDRYGKIWDLTEAELQEVLLIANEETKKIMQ